MTKKNAVSLNAMFRHLCVTFLMFSLLTIIYGCSKEKEKEKEKAAPAKVTGACEIFDKLPGDIANPIEVNYGGKFKLLGTTTNKISKDKMKVSYYWQIIDDFGLFNMIFVHFTDAGNTSLFENDHDFCQRKSYEELKGKFAKETFTVNVPQRASGQTIDVKVGVYAPEIQSNNRLKIEPAGKIPSDDANTRAFVGKISL